MAAYNKKEHRQRIQTIEQTLTTLKVKGVRHWGVFTNYDGPNKCFFCPSLNQFNCIFHLRLNTGRTKGFLVCEECTRALNKLDWNMLVRRKGVTL
jgi:hypothetical protein